jgi:hypothetical protein
MTVLPVDATDAEILAVCREWMERVAAGDVEGAIEMLHVPERYDESQRWTVGSLVRYVGNYGSWDARPDGRTWRITSPATALTPADRRDFRPTAEVVRHPTDPRSGSVDVDLPLDGEWSDLTALLKFEPVEGGIGLSLYDVHVL